MSNVHASAVVIADRGVLIRGAPGSGKTKLAFELVRLMQARGGFACLLGDDRILLSETGGRVIMRPHPAIAGQAERRWEGVVEVSYEPAAVLCCIIDLGGSAGASADQASGIERLPAADALSATIGSVAIARLALPSAQPASDNASRVLEFLDRI